jgi:hypothetical protein
VTQGSKNSSRGCVRTAVTLINSGLPVAGEGRVRWVHLEFGFAFLSWELYLSHLSDWHCKAAPTISWCCFPPLTRPQLKIEKGYAAPTISWCCFPPLTRPQLKIEKGYKVLIPGRAELDATVVLTVMVLYLSDFQFASPRVALRQIACGQEQHGFNESGCAISQFVQTIRTETVRIAGACRFSSEVGNGADRREDVDGPQNFRVLAQECSTVRRLSIFSGNAAK